MKLVLFSRRVFLDLNFGDCVAVGTLNLFLCPLYLEVGSDKTSVYLSFWQELYINSVMYFYQKAKLLMKA